MLAVVSFYGSVFMTSRKGFILCAAACLAMAADGQIETKQFGDLLVTPAPLDSGSFYFGYSLGYDYLYYDVKNTSHTHARLAAFQYVNNRTAPVLLPPGGSARFSLPHIPNSGSSWRGVHLVVDGRVQSVKAPFFNGESGDWRRNHRVLLSPGISGNAVRHRVDQLLKAHEKETEPGKSLDSNN